MGLACRRSLDSFQIWRRSRLQAALQEPCWQEPHRTPQHLKEAFEHLPLDMLYGHSHQYIPQSPSFSTLEACSIQSHVRHEGRCRSKNHWTDQQSSHEYSCWGNRITCRFRLRQCLYLRSGALEQEGLAGGVWHWHCMFHQCCSWKTNKS